MIEKKILIVEDDEFQKRSLEICLKKMGYQVKVASNAEETLSILEKETILLIITDLNMPGQNGIELCKLIRKTSDRTIIYALSGHISSYGPEKLEDSGFDGYLPKPAEIDELKQAIEGAFERLSM